MTEDVEVRRGSRAAMGVATAGAVAVLVGLGVGLTQLAPARDVEFVGGPETSGGSCIGAVLWTGEVAYSACSWAYRDHAVVAFDPETAEATVLHAWSADEGVAPALELVRPCEGGELFVVRERGHTTLVRRRGAEVRASRFASDWEAALGAECREGAVELFTASPQAWAIQRVVDDAPEQREAVGRDAATGTIVGAWFADGAWQTVVQDDGTKGLLVGTFKATPTRAEVPPIERPACVIGEPGGWLGVSSLLGCYGGVVVERADGALRVTALGRAVHDVVVQPGARPGFGVATDGQDTVQVRGPGSVAFELHERDGVFAAQRGEAAAVAVAPANTTLNFGVRALPLAGDRVAVWGSLGSQVVILGPDLRRLDAPGPVARVLRPWSRFKASSKSRFDLICFYGLVIAAPLWLLAFALAGRRAAVGLGRAAWAFVGLGLVGAWGFMRVLAWL